MYVSILPKSMIDLVYLANEKGCYDTLLKSFDLIEEVLITLNNGEYILIDGFKIEQENENLYYFNYFRVLKEKKNVAPWYLKLFKINKFVYSSDFIPLKTIEVDFYQYCEFKLKSKKQGYSNTTIQKLK